MQKQKQTSVIDNLQNAVRLGGLALMTLSAGLLVAELPNAEQRQRAVALAPRPVILNYNEAFDHVNEQRKERDESGPHYVSYGVSQRTPSRTTK